VQVAVGVVVAIRLVVLGISQPPRAAVFGPPRPLLSSGALHGVLGAATTTVGGTSHVNNQMRLLRVVVDALLHRVVQDGPVVLVARREDLVASGARVGFSALPDPFTVMNPDNIPGGIFGGFDSDNFAVLGAAGSALKRLGLRGLGTSGATFRTNLFKSRFGSHYDVVGEAFATDPERADFDVLSFQQKSAILLARNQYVLFLAERDSS